MLEMPNCYLKSGINEGINFRKIDENKIGITLDERTRPEIIEAVWKAFGLDKKDTDFTPNYES